MSGPGELFDAKGVPIYPGDLLRTPHFRDRRNRQYYLYHTAVLADGCMDMVPTCHLQPSLIRDGGRCRLSKELAAYAEVIAGYGPGEYLDYRDRPRAPRLVEAES